MLYIDCNNSLEHVLLAVKLKGMTFRKTGTHVAWIWTHRLKDCPILFYQHSIHAFSDAPSKSSSFKLINCLLFENNSKEPMRTHSVNSSSHVVQANRFNSFMSASL